MRQILIDAMKLKKSMPKFILEAAEPYIDEAEEVAAVTIMWIDSYITDSEIGLNANDPDKIRLLVEDWRAENDNTEGS